MRKGQQHSEETRERISETLSSSFVFDHHCEACGIKLERRTFPSGQKEAPSTYKLRRTCSVRCAGELRAKNSTKNRWFGPRNKGEKNGTEVLAIAGASVLTTGITPVSTLNPREHRFRNFIGAMWELARDEGIAPERVIQMINEEGAHKRGWL